MLTVVYDLFEFKSRSIILFKEEERVCNVVENENDSSDFWNINLSKVIDEPRKCKFQKRVILEY